MLDFVCVILPGIFFSFVTEKLMHKHLSTHDFCFLAVTNVLLLNLIAMGIRHFIVDFMYMETVALDLEEAKAAASAIKYLIVEGVTGTVLSLAEAFFGKYCAFRLEVTEKERAAK